MTADDLKALHARAGQGDARAQYLLAAALSRAGDRRGADRWLQSAARLGEPDAGYTLATRRLQTAQGAAEAAALLTASASAGSLSAKRLLAVLHAEGLGVETNERQAAAFVLQAAEAGDPAAMREAAMLLLLHDPGDQDGAQLLRRAALRDAVAGAAFVRWAIEARSEIAFASEALAKLKAARYPTAHFLESKLAQVEPAALREAGQSGLDWSGIAERFSLKSGWSPPEAALLCAAPRARVFRAVFSPVVCEYVIAVAAQRLAPSTTFDPATGKTRQDAYRTSLTATLGPVDLDLALISINRRIAQVAGRPCENGEFLSVLRYAPGQEYRPHFDWLPQGEDFERGGQRVTTALIYLNDDYGGGETHFQTPGVNFKGAAGDMLVFENALLDGAPDKASRHAGLPVASGAKWLGSKWFREKKYNF